MDVLVQSVLGDCVEGCNKEGMKWSVRGDCVEGRNKECMNWAWRIYPIFLTRTHVTCLLIIRAGFQEIACVLI